MSKQCLLAPHTRQSATLILSVSALPTRALMATLADLARLQAKLRELSLVVEDILAQKLTVLSPTSTPPSSPQPARVLPSPQSLPLLTPVVPTVHKPRNRGEASECSNTPPRKQSLGSVQADVTSVGSSQSVLSAILKSDNITFRVKAAGPVAQSKSSPIPIPPSGAPPRGGLASTASSRRHLEFMTEQPLEPSAGMKSGRVALQLDEVSPTRTAAAREGRTRAV